MDGEVGAAGVGGGAEDAFVSLYRRFRPGRFAELRGQLHVVRALQGAVRDGRVAHAYLFSGPRGTGKTSTARILARALNCADPQDGEPCGRCPSCLEIARGTSLDVHEMDAASNNGVDAMRDLIAHAALGTPGRWKVYIVDEVHMLSTAAANSLLKTLEEPPGHVVFVLATTDPQKVPPTIRSRTQHFEFGLLPAETLTELVRDVNAAAGLDLDESALSAVVRRGRGSARDALSALDQVAASGSAEGIRPEVTGLSEALAQEDPGQALATVARLHEAGWGPQQLATELVDDLRQAFLVSFAPELTDAVGGEVDRLADRARQMSLPRLVRAIELLGRAQVDMREAPDPRVVLEVALVRLVRPDLDDSGTALADRVARIERSLASLVSAAATRPPETAAGGDPAPPVGSSPPGARPSLGALRRQRASTPIPPAEATAAPAEEPPSAPQDSLAPDSAAPAEAAPAPAAADRPAPAAASPVPPASAATPPAVASGAPPDRDRLVEAWGDHILRGLPARAKALYSAGRFVTAEGGTARFALPNATHCQRCQEVRPAVEAVISQHFGVPVTLELVVDDALAAPTSAPPTPSPTGAAGPPSGDGPGAALGTDLDPDDDYDPTAATDANAGTSVAHAKVLEAFPGAEEVTG